jgi:hypothetical protein
VAVVHPTAIGSKIPGNEIENERVRVLRAKSDWRRKWTEQKVEEEEEAVVAVVVVVGVVVGVPTPHLGRRAKLPVPR